jgi:acetyltransferase
METLPISEVVTLRDGDTVTIRPVRLDDAPRLQSLFARLSSETVFLRFMSRATALSDQDVEHLTKVDYQTKMALAATGKQCGEECIICR